MPYLTPKNDPLDTTCRPLQIPNDTEWLGIISGALTELVKLHNWEQSDGGITREQAVARVWSILNGYWSNDCTGAATRRIYRIGITGRIEFSDDIGETWNEDEDVFPPVAPREEITEQDKLCLASRNAVEVLRLVYLELLDAWNTDSTIQYGIGALLAILGLLIAAIAGAPLLVINALINFALGAFGQAYGLMAVLGDNDWTVGVTEDLTCLFYDRASVDGDGVVTFNYMSIRDNLAMIDADPALIAWLWYIMQIVGEESINHAGATTAIAEYNCGGCGCVPGCALLNQYYYAAVLKTMIPPYTLPLAGGEPFVDLRPLPGMIFDVVLPEYRCVKQVEVRMYASSGGAGNTTVTIQGVTQQVAFSGAVWHTMLFPFDVPLRTKEIRVGGNNVKWGIHYMRIWWCDE